MRFSGLVFTISLLFLPISSSAQTSETDSLALVALYNSTDGANWTNTWDLTTPVSTWHGVEVSGGRITELRLRLNQLTGSIPAQLENLANLNILLLSYNQLNGAVPAELANLANLRDLFLYSNQLTELPDLSAMTALRTLLVRENRLTFEDLEPNMYVGASHANSYAPQDSVGMQLDTIIAAGNTLWLTASAGGTATHYQWMLNGAAIAGATDSSYALYLRGSIDAGTYTCEITNTIVTGLTLYTRPANVTVNGESAIPEELLLPEQIALQQNYPNPFNPTTSISYTVPQGGKISLIVYDINGREVARLSEDYKIPGQHKVQWNGQGLPSGIYIARLATLEYSKSIKMVLLK
ncbi:T9SS type A sorting domain-containing protein [Candidatus Neomarinimicrobiota bacterium]